MYTITTTEDGSVSERTLYRLVVLHALLVGEDGRSPASNIRADKRHRFTHYDVCANAIEIGDDAYELSVQADVQIQKEDEAFTKEEENENATE